MPLIKEPAIHPSQFILESSIEDIPTEAIHMARRCLVDTLAVWASGIATEPSRIARTHAARRYPGSIPLPFDGRKVNPIGFAFAGAASIDAIDGHDGHQESKGHASAALVPALIAELDDQPNCTLEEMLVHLVVGEEIAIRSALSLHATAPDYHSSGAWNALGCAAMAARLRAMSITQTGHALGIAEYYGPRAQMMRCIDHPTMVKDSSSWGALVGMSAADLAEDGFTGAPAITCQAPEVSDFWDDLGQRWRILETNYKAYPVCRWAHPAIEAALSLLKDQGIAINDIEAILVTTFHEATRLDTRRPLNGDAAQYSLPLTVALALLHNTILPEHLLPKSFDQPEIWSIVDKVSFAEREDYNKMFPAERCADVTLTLKDGRNLQSEMAVARGNYDAPLSDEEIIWKLNHYAKPVLSDEARSKIAAIVYDPKNAPTPAVLTSSLTHGYLDSV